MATTSIWSVKGQIDKVIKYAANPEKTEGSEYLCDTEDGSIEGVLDYATNSEKTEQQLFVSGINCSVEDAKTEMSRVKRQFKKSGGIVAFHGYQSFKPGEVAPDIAHEIGVKLATELWGERFQMVVTTHLDKGHIHNHIVINSVSCEDGKRFHRDNRCYRSMRDASDRLCREYGLSIIKNPERGGSKHYGEWKAEREGKETWRALIKRDVDEAIEKAMTDKQFFQNLERIGYEIKTGKDISVKPPGKERFVRLARNFGDGYTYEGIKRRILANKTPRMPIAKVKQNAKHPKKLPPILRGNLIGLYRHYKYLFGYYSRGSPENTRTHFLLREDIRKLDEITREMKLLERESIETVSQLLSFAESLDSQMQSLKEERKALHAQNRAIRDKTGVTPKTPRIAEINTQLKTLREEVRRCKSILVRSAEIEEKITRMESEQEPKETRKEVKTRGRNGAGGRTIGQDDAFRK